VTPGTIRQPRSQDGPAGGGQPLLAAVLEQLQVHERRETCASPRAASPANATFTVGHTPFTIRLGYTRPTASTWMCRWRPRLSSRCRRFAIPRLAGLLPGPVVPTGDRRAVLLQAEASAVVPGPGDYSTRITCCDQTPLWDSTAPTSASPCSFGRSIRAMTGVHYGINIGVLDKPRTEAGVTVAVWNATQRWSAWKKKVSLARPSPAKVISYQLKVGGTSVPAPQPFTVIDPIRQHDLHERQFLITPRRTASHGPGTIAPNETLVSVFPG